MGMQFEPTLSLRVLEPFEAYTRVHYAGESGIRWPTVDDARQRVAHSAAIDALRRLAEDLDEPAVGLHVAAELERGALDLIEYLACSCDTVRESIEVTSRYSRLLHDAIVLDLSVQGERAVWSFGVAPGLSWHPAASDFLAGVLARGLAQGTKCQLQLIELRLRQPPPSYRDEYAALFRCPVRFECEQDALVLATSELERELATADSRLRVVLERQAMQALDAIPQQQTFAARVVTHIRGALEAGDAHVGPVARSLGVSPRTLRRRLQEEGTSFGHLLDEVRRGLALDRLASDHSTIPEIATGLGFSRIPSFYRAFKRWTGTTPAEYRQRQAS